MTTAENAAFPPRRGREDAATLVWVYAVARDEEGTRLMESAPLGGLGSPPRLVRASGLAALVADVPDNSFNTHALKAQLEDLGQLEAMARAHHGTIEAAAAYATVLPLRMTTVYRDEARVRDVLTERADAFFQALDLLEGHVELGVKVFADPGSVVDAAEPGEAAGAREDGPGRAYLRRRQAQRSRSRDAYRAAGAVAAQAAEVAEGRSRGKVGHRPQQGALASAAGENVANDAYLVAASEVPVLRAALAELAVPEHGVRIEMTGPWVPYSFTEWAQSPEHRYAG
ncbi:GvpL/GvpF family gas vesicle protein [Streptomyces sp. NPDC051784]|uniref:GvpL/GvpF family gas vesicle protein n=1 Tax=Streptomyces sp. NPDC051784 TaxID=3155805 RepID=UPI0034147B4A